MPDPVPNFRNWKKLILASASPRRKEILEAAGFELEVAPASLEETQREGEAVEAFVCRVASEKAHQALTLVPQPCLHPVLGADTVVVAGGRTLGKPASAEEARGMLRLLSGREHQVLTGVCLLYPMVNSQGRAGPLWEDVRCVSTTVRFVELTEQEIEQYIATGEPFDKAGAYAIQGLASKYVEWIQGCYFNVVGLPISLVYQMLKDLASALEKRVPPEEEF